MLNSFKRLFAKPREDGTADDYSDMADWAKRRGYGFKLLPDDAGFMIEGVLEGKPWRIEWGTPQRPYIEGNELRVRMDLGLPEDMHMMVMSLPLMEALERQTFEEYVDSVQTQMGDGTPEEMRWLVMYPKLNLAALKMVRGSFGAVASQSDVGLAWIDGPLANMLELASTKLLQAGPPFVLMTLRGRAYMRMQMKQPEPRAFTDALALFETAVSQAMTASAGVSDQNLAWSSGSTAWQNLQPLENDEPSKPD